MLRMATSTMGPDSPALGLQEEFPRSPGSPSMRESDQSIESSVTGCDTTPFPTRPGKCRRYGSNAQYSPSPLLILMAILVAHR
jgi:hypothetical protein